jgi:hypothetical protein
MPEGAGAPEEGGVEGGGVKITIDYDASRVNAGLESTERRIAGVASAAENLTGAVRNLSSAMQSNLGGATGAAATNLSGTGRQTQDVARNITPESLKGLGEQIGKMAADDVETAVRRIHAAISHAADEEVKKALETVEKQAADRIKYLTEHPETTEQLQSRAGSEYAERREYYGGGAPAPTPRRVSSGGGTRTSSRTQYAQSVASARGRTGFENDDLETVQFMAQNGDSGERGRALAELAARGVSPPPPPPSTSSQPAPPPEQTAPPPSSTPAPAPTPTRRRTGGRRATAANGPVSTTRAAPAASTAPAYQAALPPPTLAGVVSELERLGASVGQDYSDLINRLQGQAAGRPMEVGEAAGYRARGDEVTAEEAVEWASRQGAGAIQTAKPPEVAGAEQLAALRSGWEHEANIPMTVRRALERMPNPYQRTTERIPTSALLSRHVPTGEQYPLLRPWERETYTSGTEQEQSMLAQELYSRWYSLTPQQQASLMQPTREDLLKYQEGLTEEQKKKGLGVRDVIEETRMPTMRERLEARGVPEEKIGYRAQLEQSRLGTVEPFRGGTPPLPTYQLGEYSEAGGASPELNELLERDRKRWEIYGTEHKQWEDETRKALQRQGVMEPERQKQMEEYASHLARIEAETPGIRGAPLRTAMGTALGRDRPVSASLITEVRNFARIMAERQAREAQRPKTEAEVDEGALGTGERVVQGFEGLRAAYLMGIPGSATGLDLSAGALPGEVTGGATAVFGSNERARQLGYGAAPPMLTAARQGYETWMSGQMRLQRRTTDLPESEREYQRLGEYLSHLNEDLAKLSGDRLNKRKELIAQVESRVEGLRREIAGEAEPEAEAAPQVGGAPAGGTLPTVGPLTEMAPATLATFRSREERNATEAAYQRELQRALRESGVEPEQAFEQATEHIGGLQQAGTLESTLLEFLQQQQAARTGGVGGGPRALPRAAPTLGGTPTENAPAEAPAAEEPQAGGLTDEQVAQRMADTFAERVVPAIQEVFARSPRYGPEQRTPARVTTPLPEEGAGEVGYEGLEEYAEPWYLGAARARAGAGAAAPTRARGRRGGQRRAPTAPVGGTGAGGDFEQAAAGIANDVIQGMLRGLSQGAPEIQAAGKLLGDAIVRGLRDALQTGSPSKVTEAIGRDVAAGLAAGIRAGIPDVQRAITELGRATGTAFQGVEQAAQPRRTGRRAVERQPTPRPPEPEVGPAARQPGEGPIPGEPGRPIPALPGAAPPAPEPAYAEIERQREREARANRPRGPVLLEAPARPERESGLVLTPGAERELREPRPEPTRGPSAIEEREAALERARAAGLAAPGIGGAPGAFYTGAYQPTGEPVAQAYRGPARPTFRNLDPMGLARELRSAGLSDDDVRMSLLVHGASAEEAEAAVGATAVSPFMQAFRRGQGRDAVSGARTGGATPPVGGLLGRVLGYTPAAAAGPPPRNLQQEVSALLSRSQDTNEQLAGRIFGGARGLPRDEETLFNALNSILQQVGQSAKEATATIGRLRQELNLTAAATNEKTQATAGEAQATNNAAQSAQRGGAAFQRLMSYLTPGGAGRGGGGAPPPTGEPEAEPEGEGAGGGGGRRGGGGLTGLLGGFGVSPEAVSAAGLGTGGGVLRTGLALFGIGGGLNVAATVARDIQRHIVEAVESEAKLERQVTLTNVAYNERSNILEQQARQYTATEGRAQTGYEYLQGMGAFAPLARRGEISEAQASNIVGNLVGPYARDIGAGVGPMSQAVAGFATGNNQALEEFGLTLTDANGRLQGLNATSEQVTAVLGQAGATWLRVQIAADALAKAHTQAATESDKLALALSDLGRASELQKQQMGQFLTPIAIGGAQVATEVMRHPEEFVGRVLQGTVTLLGSGGIVGNMTPQGRQAAVGIYQATQGAADWAQQQRYEAQLTQRAGLISEGFGIYQEAGEGGTVTGRFVSEEEARQRINALREQDHQLDVQKQQNAQAEQEQIDRVKELAKAYVDAEAAVQNLSDAIGIQQQRASRAQGIGQAALGPDFPYRMPTPGQQQVAAISEGMSDAFQIAAQRLATEHGATQIDELRQAVNLVQAGQGGTQVIQPNAQYPQGMSAAELAAVYPGHPELGTYTEQDIQNAERRAALREPMIGAQVNVAQAGIQSAEAQANVERINLQLQQQQLAVAGQLAEIDKQRLQIAEQMQPLQLQMADIQDQMTVASRSNLQLEDQLVRVRQQFVRPEMEAEQQIAETRLQFLRPTMEAEQALAQVRLQFIRPQMEAEVALAQARLSFIPRQLQLEQQLNAARLAGLEPLRQQQEAQFGITRAQTELQQIRARQILGVATDEEIGSIGRLRGEARTQRLQQAAFLDLPALDAQQAQARAQQQLEAAQAQQQGVELPLTANQQMLQLQQQIATAPLQARAEELKTTEELILAPMQAQAEALQLQEQILSGPLKAALEEYQLNQKLVTDDLEQQRRNVEDQLMPLARNDRILASQEASINRALQYQKDMMAPMLANAESAAISARMAQLEAESRLRMLQAQLYGMILGPAAPGQTPPGMQPPGTLLPGQQGPLPVGAPGQTLTPAQLQAQQAANDWLTRGAQVQVAGQVMTQQQYEDQLRTLQDMKTGVTNIATGIDQSNASLPAGRRGGVLTDQELQAMIVQAQTPTAAAARPTQAVDTTQVPQSNLNINLNNVNINNEDDMQRYAAQAAQQAGEQVYQQTLNTLHRLAQNGTQRQTPAAPGVRR